MVLLTDVIMPGMHGPALASRLMELRPGIGVIYMSGLATDVLTGPQGLGPTAGFLPKPFTADMLLASVAHGIRLARIRSGIGR